MYSIAIKPSAAAALAKLPTDTRRRIADRIDSLAHNPRPPGVQKLEGEDHAYRLRVGDYRVIYEIYDQVLTVIVIKVGHRREVYR